MDEFLLRVFVYGTLKRGFENHRRLCRGVLSIEEAEVRGKLYDLPAGYPALVVPETSILALGTSDPRADAALQQRLSPDEPPATGNAESGPKRETAGWGRVAGEILTFDDPEQRLRAFDRLEGYRPGRHSHYQRVLARVTKRHGGALVTAWLYVMKKPGPQARRLPNGRWPEG